ncbi:MAG: transposase [Polyangiaceae bacterium]|nr:transposase [Polyangiaceae bacterium]
MIAAPSNYGSTLKVLACERCDDARVQAPLGDKVVAGGAYGSRLVADLVVNKYWYGLPLNRQRGMLTRLGLDMPSSSMGDQIHWATELLGAHLQTPHRQGAPVDRAPRRRDLAAREGQGLPDRAHHRLAVGLRRRRARSCSSTRARGTRWVRSRARSARRPFLRLAQASSLRMQRPFSTRASSARSSSRSAATCTLAVTS